MIIIPIINVFIINIRAVRKLVHGIYRGNIWEIYQGNTGEKCRGSEINHHLSHHHHHHHHNLHNHNHNHNHNPNHHDYYPNNQCLHHQHQSSEKLVHGKYRGNIWEIYQGNTGKKCRGSEINLYCFWYSKC